MTLRVLTAITLYKPPEAIAGVIARETPECYWITSSYSEDELRSRPDEDDIILPKCILNNIKIYNMEFEI